MGPKSGEANNLTSSPEFTLFHAFHWLALESQRSESSANEISPLRNEVTLEENTIYDLLNEISHDQIGYGSVLTRKAYEHCHPKSLQEVTIYLLSVTRDERYTDGYDEESSISEDFFKASTQAFELFLPLQNGSIVSQKFWGAVFFILKVCDQSATTRIIGPVLTKASIYFCLLKTTMFNLC